jgi:hypothetical protein
MSVRGLIGDYPNGMCFNREWQFKNNLHLAALRRYSITGFRDKAQYSLLEVSYPNEKC